MGLNLGYLFKIFSTLKQVRACRTILNIVLNKIMYEKKIFEESGAI
jgi:hypothetical protein